MRKASRRMLPPIKTTGAPAPRTLSPNAQVISGVLAEPLAKARALAHAGTYEDSKVFLRTALQLAFETLAQREIDAAMAQEWPHLQRYGVPQKEWRQLYLAAMTEWLPGYLDERVALILDTTRRYAEAGTYEPINSDERRRTIATTEAASFHGAALLLFATAYNAVADEVNQ